MMRRLRTYVDIAVRSTDRDESDAVGVGKDRRFDAGDDLVNLLT